MAKKQAKPAPTVTPAIPAKAPRVSSSRHSKAKVESPVETEPAAIEIAAEPIVAAEVILEEITTPVAAENPHQAISKIAYGYYEARGYNHGNPLDDWFRAEREFYGRR